MAAKSTHELVQDLALLVVDITDRLCTLEETVNAMNTPASEPPAQPTKKSK